MQPESQAASGCAYYSWLILSAGTQWEGSSGNWPSFLGSHVNICVDQVGTASLPGSSSTGSAKISTLWRVLAFMWGYSLSRMVLSEKCGVGLLNSLVGSQAVGSLWSVVGCCRLSSKTFYLEQVVRALGKWDGPFHCRLSGFRHVSDAATVLATRIRGSSGHKVIPV